MTYPTSALTLIFLPPSSAAQAAPAGYHHGARVDVDLPKRDPDTGASLGLLPSPFGQLLIGSGPATIPAGGLRLSGRQHIVTPGDGAVLVVMLARRKAGMSHAAWRDRWLHGHARFGLDTAASGYRQLHPSTPPGADGFDGAGLVFFRDLDHVVSARAAPAIADAATRDEMAFIDHRRSMLMMFRLDD